MDVVILVVATLAVGFIFRLFQRHWIEQEAQAPIATVCFIRVNGHSFRKSVKPTSACLNKEVCTCKAMTSGDFYRCSKTGTPTFYRYTCYTATDFQASIRILWEDCDRGVTSLVDMNDHLLTFHSDKPITSEDCLNAIDRLRISCHDPYDKSRKGPIINYGIPYHVGNIYVTID